MKTINPFLAAAFAAVVLFLTVSPIAVQAQQATWTPWESLGDAVSVSFSQVDSATWTWRFRNDGTAAITYMDFNYTDSSGQNYDVLPGTITPGNYYGGWAAFTSSGRVASIQLKTVTRGNSSTTAGNGQPLSQLNGGSQISSPNQQTPPPTRQEQQALWAAQQHLANAQAYQAEGQAISAAATNAVAAFQGDLAPYGKWMDLNGQMYWQPNDATPGGNWRPYADNGNWVYTEAGWTWNSGYQWGWAPFHYGRWADDPVLGWIWQPGSVWAPAWVAWRGDGAYCGWAPLPPGSGYEVGFGFKFRGVSVSMDFDFGLGPDDYFFINISDMCQPNYKTCQVPLARAAQVYKQTAAVKTAYRARGGQFINAGIAVDRVRAATHQEIKPLKLADAGAIRERGTQGNTLTVYRPKIGVPRPVELSLRADQVMDDLLRPGPPAQKPGPARAGDVMDDLLGGGSAARKPAQETAHDSDDIVNRLLTRGHDTPPPKISAMTRPVEQPRYGAGTPASQPAYSPPAPTSQPAQPGYQQPYQPPQQFGQQPGQWQDQTAQREREAAAQREREAAAQREREAAAQREREVAAQREREAAAQREREAAAQREREAAAQREREAAAQREREAAAQREREAAAKKITNHW